MLAYATKKQMFYFSISIQLNGKNFFFYCFETKSSLFVVFQARMNLFFISVSTIQLRNAFILFLNGLWNLSFDFNPIHEYDAFSILQIDYNFPSLQLDLYTKLKNIVDVGI
jgi:hypothetical protein